MASSSEKSQGSPRAEGRWSRGSRAVVREVVVPIVLALIFIQFVVQTFKIPSASMERSLHIGDFLLGMKFVYGSPIPFTDKRLPSFTEPKPGDVLIFRYPGDPSYPEGSPERYRFVANLFLFGNLYWDRTPAEGEKRLVWYAPKDFIKRAVAQSGQLLEVEGTRVRVDGRELVLPREGQYTAGTGATREDDPVRDHLRFRLPKPGETIAFDTLSLTHASWIRSLAIQENPASKVELRLDLKRGAADEIGYVIPMLGASRNDRNAPAAIYFLGVPYDLGADSMIARGVPFARVQDAARTGYLRLQAPARTGLTGSFSRDEMNEYFMGNYLEFIAREVERQDPGLRVRASLVIDGKVMDRYTVQKTSYFMMGDNRDQSSDSRYWGLLSRNNVKAKALIIYYSFENEDRGFSFANPLSWFTVPFKIRWTRLGRLID